MFAAEHMYVTVHGEYYAGLENWQFGLRISDGGISSQSTALALAPIIETWWRAITYPAGEQILPSQYARLTELKVARIAVDGTYPANEVAYSHFYSPAIPGRGVNETRPFPQITVCATLYTAVPRGLGSKGRIYLPALEETVPEADGRMSVTHAATIAKSVRTLISRIDADPQVGNVQVMSKGKAVRGQPDAKGKYHYTYPNPGVSNNVTGVRVGRVADTQRRRRRSLTESPEAAVI